MPLPDIQIPEPDVSQADCDQALGTFFRCWDQLELALFNLLHKLLDSDVGTARILFYSDMNLRTMREIIGQLGKHRLKQNDHRKLIALTRRLKNAATKRNRIVHGTWTLFLTMPPPPRAKPLRAESVKWVRQYNPIDGDKLGELALGKNEKLNSAYQFSPKRLITCGKDVLRLVKDMNEFTALIALLKVQNPQPVDW